MKAIEFETEILNGLLTVPASYKIDSLKKVKVIILFDEKSQNLSDIHKNKSINQGKISKELSNIYNLAGKFRDYPTNSDDFMARKQIEKELET